MRQALILAAALTAADGLAAQEAFLTLPLACDLGRTCYIEDYVDTSPGPGQQDYTCGIKSRDGHKGTDFALITQDQFRRGIAVIAAAPGEVMATRDGMPDRAYSADTAAAVGGRECGNAVRIRHENGLQTLYCHLAQGSVRVRTGDVVARGDILGRVGMSGKSNYPHVHLGVLGGSQNIDPFAPASRETCGETDRSLWLNPPAYTPTGMFTAAFSDRVPSFEDVGSGAARLSESAAGLPLVLYSHFFYARDGDVLHLYATGPDGSTILSQDIVLDNPKVNQFRAYGRKAPAGGWPAGTYAGRAVLTRGDEVLAVRFASIEIR